MLLNVSRLKNGAKVILYKVSNPELFGVAKLNKSKTITVIKEKPKSLLLT
jgi:glucose-1-phosphate thymidylyltransferase